MNSMRTMRRVRFALRSGALASLAVAAACASTRGGLPADAPDWVNNGGGRVDGRVFYGVGSSSGVANVGLSRKRAAAQARNEIGLLINSYSASLMKDYSASISTGDLSNSSEEQLVESVVKTFTSELLVGVEVKNYYTDPNSNTVYALAELDLDKREKIAAMKAKMGDQSGFAQWVQDNSGKILQSLEGEMKPRKPAPSTGGGGSGVSGAQPVSPAAPVGVSAAPAPDLRSCDDSRFLCATGQGSDAESADVAARSELARIFEANIKSVAQSYANAAQTISSKTGEEWIETQQFTEQSLVSTNKDVRMSRILGRWVEGGTHNSLVGIDRQQATRDLSTRIEELDKIVVAEIDRAQDTEDAVQRLKFARSAVESFVKREALNSDLRVIRKNGRGIPAPVSMADLLALLQEAGRQLKLGIALAGRGAERMQGCLEEKLTAKGYEIQSKADDSASSVDLEGEFDVLLSGKLTSEKLDVIRGSTVVKVKLTLRLVNNKTKKILKTINASQKGTRRTETNAIDTASYQLCKRQVPGMIKTIDRYFVR